MWPVIGERTRTVVIGVVTAVWAANFLAGVVIPEYQPSESINGIFMAIVGGLFALGARGNGGNGGNGGGGSAPPPVEPSEAPKEGTADPAGP